MVYVQSALATYGGFLLREEKRKLRRKRETYMPSLLHLEEEIHLLRVRMEELYDREKSLTSPPVVEASTRLDLKINEYMQRKEGQ